MVLEFHTYFFSSLLYGVKGNLYKFFATSSEPLVMIRVGNPAHKHMGHPNRVNAQGNEMKGDSKENKKVEVVFKDQFFGDK